MYRLVTIFKKLKKMTLLIAVLIPILNFLVVKINIYVNDVLPIFKRMNGVDMMYIVNNDMMEVYMNITIIILLVSTIIRKTNYSERIRFKNRGEISKYYLTQSIVINFIFTATTIISLFVFSYFLMPSKNFHWTTQSHVLEVIFGELAKSNSILPWQNNITVLMTFFVKTMFRNIVVSTFLLILMMYLKKGLSVVVCLGISLYILSSDNIFSKLCGIGFLDFASVNRIVGNISMMVGILMIIFGAYYFLFTRKDYIDSVDKSF